ncbi:unnamed protein product [Rhizophagus irregularis]|nr:unnamed protein product [Rhizophagus irregularis]
MDFDNDNDEEEKSDEDENNMETPTEKRRRLAKQYIESVKKELDEAEFDAAEIDRDLIAERLKKDALEQTGRAHRIIADTFSFPIEDSNVKSGRHELTVTCVAVAENGQIFYTGSKDASIIKWDLVSGKKLHTFPGGRKEVKNFDGHTNHVLSLAISSDGKYLASGDSISSLAFRKGSNQLYSASFDRTIKIWNIDELCYVDTLYGHQDQIMIVKRDNQTFMEDSIDVVEMIDEDNFLSGGNSGTISLWNIGIKKADLCHTRLAHGHKSEGTDTFSILDKPH